MIFILYINDCFMDKRVLENIINNCVKRVLNEVKYLSMTGDEDVVHNDIEYYVRAIQNISRLPRTERDAEFPVKHEWIDFNDIPQLSNYQFANTNEFLKKGPAVLADYLQIPSDWVRSIVKYNRFGVVALDTEKIKDFVRSIYRNPDYTDAAGAISILFNDNIEIARAITNPSIEWRPLPENVATSNRWLLNPDITYRVGSDGTILAFNLVNLRVNGSLQSRYNRYNSVNMTHLGNTTTIDTKWAVALTFPDMIQYENDAVRDEFTQNPGTRKLGIRTIDGDHTNTTPENLLVYSLKRQPQNVNVAESIINRIVKQMINEKIKA